MEGSDLISMPAKFEKSNFRYQIPKDNVRVSRSACKTYTGVVEGKMGDGRLVAIERNYNGFCSRIPYPDTAIFIPKQRES